MKKAIGDLRDKSLEALRKETVELSEELAKLQLAFLSRSLLQKATGSSAISF